MLTPLSKRNKKIRCCYINAEIESPEMENILNALTHNHVIGNARNQVLDKVFFGVYKCIKVILLRTIAEINSNVNYVGLGEKNG
jgi:hypothetical protein